MVACRNCARTVIVLAVLAPLFSLVVLGVSHNKVTGQNTNKPTDSKSAHLVVSHVKKQSNVITDSHGSLLFDPPLLDFGDCAVSVVWRQKVNIRNNRLDEKPINILSISGSSLHFHCSFVQDKILEPAANTSFEVVFLSREEGYVEDTLYIHTSRGAFPYTIQARGMPNPFMAKPFVNVRIPVNTTFSPLIHLYNPFASALQVLEMFGSSCDLHLEMPVSGERENNDSLDWWLIPPHQSKAIAKVNFLAMRAVNITAFVRIRTNYTAHPHGSLMLPVSLEVTSQPLLFCPQQYLDFGVVNAQDPPKTLKLFVINSGNRPITVQSVVASPASEGLSIEFIPVKVPPSLTTPTLVALVTFRPNRVSQLRSVSGRITIQSKSGQFKATVGYQVTVATSCLHYNRSSTQFLAGHHLHLPSCQPFSVSNEFALPVHVMEAVLSAQDYIQARDFSQQVLKTREQGSILSLCLVKMPPLLNAPFTTNLHIKTNASAGLDISVSVFTGKVVPYWSDDLEGDQDEDDGSGNNATDRFIGWLTEGSSKELYLALWNPNPIGVSLQGWGTNCSSAILTYLGSESGSPAQFKARGHYGNLTMATTLRPDSYAVFQVQVQMPREQKEGEGVEACVRPPPSALVVHVRTVFETVAINLHFRTVAGSIKTIPAPLPWSANFLDPYLTAEVRLNSTLKEPVTVIGFQASQPAQHKLGFNLFSGNATSIVQSMQSAGVARLTYPLDWDCALSARSQLVSDWQLGQQRWWNAFGDLDLASALYACHELVSQTMWQQMASVKLVTKEIGFTEMPLRIDVKWPRLAVKRRLHFPLTEMGRSSRVDLKLANPTASVVLAQILWLEDAQVEMKELVAKLPAHLTEGIELPSFSGLKKKAVQQEQQRQKPAFRLTEGDEQDSNSPPSHDSVMVYLMPGSQAQLSVTFSPTLDMKYRSLLVIKNNVTGLELVSLSGQGQSAKFLLANRKPGSSQPLLFDISEQHLKNCEGAGPNGDGTGWHSRFQYLLPSVTVKRTFTARNRGPFPITITGFDINHSPCEGYGFRVLQCQPLTLLPNQSHSVEVAFTPDFTQTRVRRTLRLHSTVGGRETPLNFTLMATLPTHMLVLCAAVLPRPNWELFFYYGSVVTTVVLLLCVVTAASLEADRILKSGMLAMVTVVSPSGSGIEYSPATAGHLLDLRAVVREASPPVSHHNPGPPASTIDNGSKSNGNGKGKKSNNKTGKKARSSASTVSVPSTAPGKTTVPAWIPSSVVTTTTSTSSTSSSSPSTNAKRSTTPSPTMSSSSQRSQSPPPSPPSPPPPAPLKVITTKEETRLFKLKPKKTKASKTSSNGSSSEENKNKEPKKESVAAQLSAAVTTTAAAAAATTPKSPGGGGKRARSSSVPSNDRSKSANAPPAQKSSKPDTDPPAAPTSPVTIPPSPVKEDTISGTAPLPATSSSLFWQPRAQTKSLAKKNSTTAPSTSRPQPPVGKIIPEVRRPVTTGLEQQENQQSILPKPIGYRHAQLEKKQSPTWNTGSPNPSSWFGLTSSPVQQSGAWPWPETDSSLFSRTHPGQESSSSSRDWFGLRSLASELTTTTSSSSHQVGSSVGMSHHTVWPSSSPSLHNGSLSTGNTSHSTTLWPDVESLAISSGVPTVSRVYSPWSVPHWLDMTQSRQQEHQQPAVSPAQHHDHSVLDSGIWDPSRVSQSSSNNNTSNSKHESWNINYSQF